ncbi:hypothetical protein BSKO_01551 [Bryopsis sp. KO-2023]|nr:hypothetical protein BSKO_01551 [Bryopsis sp. KO-2023]
MVSLGICLRIVAVLLAVWSVDSRLQQRHLSEHGTEGDSDSGDVDSEGPVTSQYFSNGELEGFIKDFASGEKCGKISRWFKIGQSVNGTDLLVLEISNNPGKEEAKPNFHYVGNMHGDEPTGRQLLLKLAEWLCDNYPRNAKAKRIVEGMHLYLLPTMNPDGFDMQKRYNTHRVDLNRNFPDRVISKHMPMEPTGQEEPETLAIMKWVESGFFAASGNLHEGAVVANYPWDARDDGKAGYATSPDDAAFIFLSKVYSYHHREMHKSEEFKDGITNGNDWYPLYGGMQDWEYINGHCLDITLELSENKSPPAHTLYELWLDNKNSLLDMPIAAVFGGLSGFVKDVSGYPLNATISVENIAFTTTSRPTLGDYYRVLAPGVYTVSVHAEGYLRSTAEITVPEPFDEGVVHDFVLRMEGGDSSGASIDPARIGANMNSTSLNYTLLMLLAVVLIWVVFARRRRARGRDV